MSILDRLNFRSKKSKSVVGNFAGNATPRNVYSSAYQFYKGAVFDNAYPSIRAISNAFLEIKPYAIDVNGKPLNKTRLTDVLARPNQAMSGADFREALAVSALVHRKTYILVWHAEGGQAVAGGNITKDNITGFTFLENVAIMPDGSGSYYYLVDNKYSFTKDEVIEISAGYDPDNLQAGYSPSQASHKWATIDDCIASMQAGFFENGAVPAGQFVITAGSVEQFNDIVDAMQAKHRGAGQNNNVQYVHRPIGLDGSAQVSQVEWIPFAQPNSSLGLKEIFEQANQKIDSVYGVPASIRGVNTNNTYASVKVDEQIFLKYSVRPFATKIWSRFMSELNRITGGFGYGLKFDLELPYIADEEKVESERKKTELDIMVGAMSAGFELDSIIDAFGFSNAYKKLRAGSATSTEIENDKAEVDEGGETEDKPSGVVDIPKAKSHSLTCSCGEHHKAIDIKGRNVESQMKSILMDFYKEQVDKTLKVNSLSLSKAVPVEYGQEQFDEDGDGYLDDDELQNYLNSIVVEESTEEERSHLGELLGILLIAYMLSRGENIQAQEWALVRQQIASGALTSPILEKIATENKTSVEKLTKAQFDKALGEYTLSLPLENSYKSRIDNISLSFSKQVNESIKKVLVNIEAEARATGRPVTRQKIAEEIKKVVKTDDWRVERIAVTEENHARQLAQIDGMKDLANKLSLNVKKKWLALGAEPCEFCASMNGDTRDIDEDFVGIGGVIIGTDGGILQNRYDVMQTAQAHPNCQCKIQFIFED